MAHPWVGILESHPWRYATDGKMILFAAGLPVIKDVPPLDRRSENEVAGYFTIPDTCRRYQTPLAALQAWCANLPALPPAPACPVCHGTRQRPCKACDGRGKWECECDCGLHHHERTCATCKETGREPCTACTDGTAPLGDVTIVPGSLFGLRVDLRRLHHIINNLPGAMVDVFIETWANTPVRIATEGWRAVIMPLRDQEYYRQDRRYDIGTMSDPCAKVGA